MPKVRTPQKLSIYWILRHGKLWQENSIYDIYWGANTLGTFLPNVFTFRHPDLRFPWKQGQTSPRSKTWRAKTFPMRGKSCLSFKRIPETFQKKTFFFPGKKNFCRFLPFSLMLNTLNFAHFSLSKQFFSQTEPVQSLASKVLFKLKPWYAS
jgi:hypothetical protein